MRTFAPRASFLARWISFLLVVSLFAGAGGTSAFEVSEKGFKTPVISRQFIARPPVLIDLTEKIEGNETLVQKFLSTSQEQEEEMYVGFSIFSIAGVVFAYLVNAKTTVSGQETIGFMLLDNDGDGIFETKYASAETAEVPPAWVIEEALKRMEKMGTGER